MENISITAPYAYGLGRPPYGANHSTPAALSGVPITLINSGAKGRLQLPARSWLGGKATLECVCLQPVTCRESRAALFHFKSAKQMRDERGLHRLLQILTLFRRHSALRRGRQNFCILS